MNAKAQGLKCAWTRLNSATTAQLRSVQQYFDRRHLEASLASLIDAANGHEAEGLAPGAPLYKVLYKESEFLVSAFCERWQVSPQQLNAELPVLGKLRSLAQPAPRTTALAKVLLGILATLVVSLLLGQSGRRLRALRLSAGRWTMMTTFLAAQAALALALARRAKRAAVERSLAITHHESAPMRLLAQRLRAQMPIPTWLERAIAARTSAFVRTFVRTPSFELLVLRAVIKTRKLIQQKGGFR